jgi:hypothetical protein
MVNAMFDLEGAKEIGIGSWMLYAACEMFMWAVRNRQPIDEIGWGIPIMIGLLLGCVISFASIAGACLIAHGIQRERNQ